MNSQILWKKRAGERMKELLRYGRYILNDHLLFVVIIGIGGGGYYYQGWVKNLTPDFPTAFLFAFLFAFLLTGGNVITFLKEPDKVYLLLLETKLKKYFLYSYALTLLWHCYILLITLLIVAPIFVNTGGRGGELLYFSLVLVLMKAYNLSARWNMDYDPDRTAVSMDFLLRLILNGILLYFYLIGSKLFFFITLGIFLIYGAYFYTKRTGKPLPWERLIENEEKRMGTFYRLANLFTDVPALKNRVRRRRWLDFLLRPISYSRENTYIFLLSRTFFRSGDYFGLFLRLTIIGGVLVWGLKNTWISLAAAVLFIYLTGFQLFGLARHHDAIIWTSLYPLGEKRRKGSFLKILFYVLAFQGITFTLITLISFNLIQGLVLFLVLGIFVYLFVFYYMRNRLEKLGS